MRLDPRPRLDLIRAAGLFSPRDTRRGRHHRHRTNPSHHQGHAVGRPERWQADRQRRRPAAQLQAAALGRRSPGHPQQPGAHAPDRQADGSIARRRLRPLGPGSEQNRRPRHRTRTRARHRQSPTLPGTVGTRRVPIPGCRRRQLPQRPKSGLTAGVQPGRTAGTHPGAWQPVARARPGSHPGLSRVEPEAW